MVAGLTSAAGGAGLPMLCAAHSAAAALHAREAPLPGIAHLVAGLFENVDLSPSDISTALILAAASQQQRRKMRIKRALADKVERLSGTRSRRDTDTASATSTEAEQLSGACASSCWARPCVPPL